MWSKIKQTGVVAVVMLALGIVLGFGASSPALTVHSQAALDAETALFRSIYSKANPSVVSIDVRIPQTGGGQSQFGLPFGGRPQQQNVQPFAMAAGSGFVYDTQGDIVTNAHVVQGADRIEITFSDNTQMMAKVVGDDPDSDLAVIKAQGDTSKYQPLPLGDSSAAQVGDRVVAIGNPFTWSGTMTQGIVSGLHRSVQGLTPSGNGSSYQIPDAIQTDAALNPGNSGGPLLNEQAQVIGVNEQIESQVRQSSGVSFSIPSNLVKQVADILIKDGKIQHSWLGIGGVSLTLDANQTLNLADNTHGVYVQTVDPNGPASAAGLRGANNGGTGGDIIVGIDHQPVSNFDDLTAYLFSKTQVGQSITLSILRGGKQQDVQVKLGARPAATSS